jgi:FkbM family methyltransferase
MQTDLIFDIGAHNGNDTAYYLSRGFRVVAVEAHPQYCCALYQRFREAIAAARLHVLNFAIAERSGLCTLLESQAESQWNTIVPEVAASKSGDFHEIIVPALTFDHVFERFNTPYYLKVDIEGSELNVFRHLVDRPQYVSFETGPDVFTNLRILRDLGYSRYKLVNQRLIHLEAVAWSGPFGEDTEGPWVNDQVLEEQLRAIQTPGSIRPDDWFDIHVGL